MNSIEQLSAASLKNTSAKPQIRGIEAVRHSRLKSAVVFLLLIAPTAQSWSEMNTTYNEIEPILAEKCVMCHSGQSAAAGLQLDSFDAILKGSSRGAVVKTAEPSDSELIRRIKGISQPRMPMTGPPFLSDSEIASIER